jgi:hypothetical protein
MVEEAASKRSLWTSSFNGSLLERWFFEERVSWASPMSVCALRRRARAFLLSDIRI